MDSFFINIGYIQIRWYSVLILSAIIIAYTVIRKEAIKKGLSDDELLNITFYSIILGIIGARLYYVLFNLDYYFTNPREILMIWHGGLAIHGGLITALIFLLFYTKNKKIKLVLLLDVIVVGLILAQSIGRWGNFFNQEAFGRVVAKSFLENLHLPKFIIKGMYINSNYREPTFLYESVLSFIGFILLLVIRKIKQLKTGALTSIYLIWYGIIRLIIESFRSDSLMIGNIKTAQIISLIEIICGAILLVISLNNKYYKKDLFIN